MRAVRVINVSELPREMSHPKCQPERYRPVVQFIKDWNAAPAQRQEMLCGGRAPIGGRAADLALVAAVVHGLCARDGVAIPEWVASHWLADPITMSGRPVDSAWGRWVASQAPAVCSQHGVYYEADTLGLR